MKWGKQYKRPAVRALNAARDAQAPATNRSQHKAYAMARLAAVGKRPVTKDEIEEYLERKRPPSDRNPAAFQKEHYTTVDAITLAEKRGNSK